MFQKHIRFAAAVYALHKCADTAAANRMYGTYNIFSVLIHRVWRYNISMGDLTELKEVV
ncbi:MAG TPA: hypothetical protein PK052_05230 [Anaerohalosphaeraceae bacterium]|nr:hypothetical protein [Phycisphaerae bacterium]HOK96065.1 hypothetical protein [Anaerohalosphaeraceae bacterium]HOL31366.1 hypothetical protein [Anaerohalosphaeraceae bacterium]HOM75178.1 hypothetical protein [Anaerohalosphaeraceae bacterium]HPO69695.1 hypothetical protein [Anaerohalosphaeraceae bacterium]